MSEWTRWLNPRPTEIIRRPSQEVRRVVSVEIRRIDAAQVMHQRREMQSRSVVDLPQTCAVHVRPELARYVKFDRFHYAQSIRLTQSLYRFAYEDNDRVCSVPTEDLEEETCAWCGAVGVGGLWCLRAGCGLRLCWGTAIHKFARCPCGNDGPIRNVVSESVGGMHPFIGGR
jgi:hypothetical protein